MQKNKSKLVIGIILVLIGVGLVVWVLMSRQAEAPAVTPSSSASETEDSEPAGTDEEPLEEATITFTNDGFTPSRLTVKKGATITVRNEATAPVQFSSDSHPTHSDNPEMNLTTLTNGQSASFTANEVGEWGFHDHVDHSKTGMLIVVE